jgi:hypothetical protein
MPYFRNDNAHGVRVGNSRIAPGTVALVPDEDADLYATYEGVEKVSDSAGKKAVDEQRGAGAVSPESPSAEIQAGLADLRVAHRAAAVSAPLQVVRGDDDAPLGPPSGVITTKQAVAKDGSEAERRAFADHEYDEVPEGASPIEKAQAANTAAVEEVAQDLASRLESGEPVADAADEKE